MRRATLCGLTLLIAAVAAAQSTGSQLLQKFTKALNSAQTLSVTYTVQPIGGVSTNYKLEFAKPNLAKIDTPVQLIVADGTSITTYNKKDKTYYKRPQTDADLKKLVSGGDLYLWLGFFDPKIDAKCLEVRSLGVKARRGVTYNTVAFKLAGSRPTSVTYYLHQGDFVARQAEFTVKSPNTQDIIVFDAKSVLLGGKADPKLFAFAPPEGSRQLTDDELNAAKWYTDIDEAVSVAQRTNRMVMAYFGADW